MNTRQVMQAIRGLEANSIGVYAADHVPKTLSLPAAIISNLDTANKPGSHWIGIYIDRRGHGKYFDSYGQPPSSPHHLDRLKRNCNRYEWNKKSMQSYDSQVCGEYCIMFLYFMCSGGTLRAFQRIFSSNTRSNDEIVARFRSDVMKKIRARVMKNRVYKFPRESSVGSGSCVQACQSRLN